MRKMGICAISALSIQASTVAGAQTAVPLTPRDFIRAAAESDHYEIAAATVAQTQSHDPRVRAFAQKMMQDHIQTSVALTRAAIAAGLALPEPGMSGDQSSFLASLQSLRGLDFDRAYAKQQILAHASALAVEQSFAVSGGEPNLRQTAHATVSIVSSHLTMSKQLQDKVGEN